LFSRPFAFLVRTAPRVLVGWAAVLSAVGLVLAVRFLVRDPFEYDFGKLRDKEREVDYARKLAQRVSRIRGEGYDGLILLADRTRQGTRHQARAAAPQERGRSHRRRGERRGPAAHRAAGKACPPGAHPPHHR